MKKFEDPNQILIPFPEEEKDLVDEKPLSLVKGFAARTQEERDDDGAGIYNTPNIKSKRDLLWEEKEKNRIFDQGAMSAMRVIINSFKVIVVSDLSFNGNFSEKSDASDFEKIRSKVLEYTRRGDNERVNNLNRGMGVLRRVNNMSKMLDNLDHQKFIDYFDKLNNTNKNTCNVIVQSKQYDELLEIINNYRQK